MNNIKQSFEKIHQRFIARKEYVKQVLDRFKIKGKIKEYQDLNQLLSNAEKLDRELQSNLLMVTAEGHLGESVLREKVKSFKKTFKELHAITKPWWQQWGEAIIIAVALAFVVRTIVFGLYCLPSGSAEPTLLIGDKVWANKFIYFFKEPQRGELVIFDSPEYPYANNKIVYWWQRYIGLPIPFLGINGGPENVVKRLIALPGDTIEGRIEGNCPVVYLNGKKLDEPYVNSYPLIRVRRMVGFIDNDHFGPFSMPSFLRWRPYGHVGAGFSYDPDASFTKQPYYNMSEDEIIRDPLTGGFALSYPSTPSYELTSVGTVRCADEFGPITLPEDKYWVMGDSRKNSRDSRFFHFLDKKLIHGRASFIILSIDSCESFWFFELLKHPIDFWTKKIRWDRFLKGLGIFNGRPDLQKTAS